MEIVGESSYYNQIVPWIARLGRNDRNMMQKYPFKTRQRKRLLGNLKEKYFYEKKLIPWKKLEKIKFQKNIYRHATPTGIEINPQIKKREILIYYGILIRIEFCNLNILVQ